MCFLFDSYVAAVLLLLFIYFFAKLSLKSNVFDFVFKQNIPKNKYCINRRYEKDIDRNGGVSENKTKQTKIPRPWKVYFKTSAQSSEFGTGG